MSRLCQCLVDDTEGKRFTAAGTDGNTVCKDNRLSAEINEHRVQLPQRHFLLISSSCGHLQLQRKTLSDFPSHPPTPFITPHSYFLSECLTGVKVCVATDYAFISLWYCSRVRQS